jgi:hypothetical protein
MKLGKSGGTEFPWNTTVPTGDQCVISLAVGNDTECHLTVSVPPKSCTALSFLSSEHINPAVLDPMRGFLL